MFENIYIGRVKAFRAARCRRAVVEIMALASSEFLLVAVEERGEKAIDFGFPKKGTVRMQCTEMKAKKKPRRWWPKISKKRFIYG